MAALLNVLAACMLAAPAIATHQHNVLVAQDVGNSTVDCDQFANSSLKIHGYNLGPLLAAVCDVWPASYGNFPVDNVQAAAALVNATFGDGGVVDKVSELVKNRKENATFCWKQDVSRELMEPTGYECPQYFNNGWVHERVMDVVPTRGPSGNMTCEKTCADICFDEFQLMEELPNQRCKCRSKEPMSIGTSGSHYVWAELDSVVPAQPEGCSFTDEKAHCFGRCPAGFEGAFLEGTFSPLCATTCNSTTNPHECGFGCAQSIGKCMTSMTDQIAEIVRVAGAMASFFMAGPQAAVAFDALVSTVEFTMTILGDLVNTFVRAVFAAKRRKEKLGVILALVASAVDFGGELFKDRAQLAAEFTHVVSLLGDLMDSKWSWFGREAKDLPGIRDTLMQHGPGAIMEVYNLFKAFFWPRCEPAPVALVV